MLSPSANNEGYKVLVDRNSCADSKVSQVANERSSAFCEAVDASQAKRERDGADAVGARGPSVAASVRAKNTYLRWMGKCPWRSQGTPELSIQ